jgi:hypothetical protein
MWFAIPRIAAKISSLETIVVWQCLSFISRDPEGLWPLIAASSSGSGFGAASSNKQGMLKARSRFNV